jgi:hypothetical protein
MQRLLLPHRRIRNDVPLRNRNHPHRKKIHRPFLVPLPPRTMHIQAVLIPPPAINRRLHLHPQNRTAILHRHVIPPRLPIRLQHPHPQPLRPRHKTKLRPLSPFLASRNPLRIVFLPHVPTRFLSRPSPICHSERRRSERDGNRGIRCFPRHRIVIPSEVEEPAFPRAPPPLFPF